MAETIYFLCTLTSLACTWLLYASYRRTRYRLLFWSAACFAALSANNILLVLDKILLPTVDLVTARLVTAFIAIALLLYGLIYEKE
ncbi:MAG: DUF5985 family protein [Massilia sp.]